MWGLNAVGAAGEHSGIRIRSGKCHAKANNLRHLAAVCTLGGRRAEIEGAELSPGMTAAQVEEYVNGGTKITIEYLKQKSDEDWTIVKWETTRE